MSQKFKSRRGATLAEIMVALALVAIMIVMVVSFALLLSDRTQANSENLSIQQERAMIKSGVETWLTAIIKENAALSLNAANPETLVTESAAGLEIVRPGSETSGCAVWAERNGKTPLSLTFAYGALKGQLPDGKTVTVRAQHTETIAFYLVKNELTAEYLLYCSSTDTLGTYTFCVNPHVGETGGV